MLVALAHPFVADLLPYEDFPVGTLDLGDTAERAVTDLFKDRVSVLRLLLCRHHRGSSGVSSSTQNGYTIESFVLIIQMSMSDAQSEFSFRCTSNYEYGGER